MREGGREGGKEGGRKGVAIHFVKEDAMRIVRDIEQYYRTQIDEMPMNVVRSRMLAIVGGSRC